MAGDEGRTYWIDYSGYEHISTEYTCEPGNTEEEDVTEIVQWLSDEFADSLHGEPVIEENLNIELAEYWEDEEGGIVYRSWHDMLED